MAPDWWQIDWIAWDMCRIRVNNMGPTWHRINDKVIALLETCAKPVITKLGPHGTGLMTKSLNCMRHVQNQCWHTGATRHHINDKPIELHEACAKPVLTEWGPHGTGCMTKSSNCMRHVHETCAGSPPSDKLYCMSSIFCLCSKTHPPATHNQAFAPALYQNRYAVSPYTSQ